MKRILRVSRTLWEQSRRSPVMGETQRFLLLSIIIGIFAGLVVVCFHFAIEALAWNTVHAYPHGSPWMVVLWPAIGAGVSGLLVFEYFKAARGSGINNTKAALYVSDGYIPFNSVIGKFAGSSISIGTGNPMGPEDPALQMGAGIASYLGRLFHLTRENMRLIAPIGAAAGIGAAFNTPITAVLFVMEEVVSAWNTGVLGSIVLSAVAAVVVSRWFLGDEPLFQVPEFSVTHPSELIVYALIGIVGGVLSAWTTRSVTRLRARILPLPRRIRYILPVLAGLVVGVIGLWLPEVTGAGYPAIDGALHNRFPWRLLLLMGAVKMMISALCFSVNTPGGLFAPTLFVGAMLGGGLGGLAEEYWPAPTSAAGAYVLVGMGTFFAGLFRAPMTSIFMVFEVSATYVIILPVMIANTISFLISRSLQHESLFQIVAHQDGLNLPSVEEEREAPRLSVEDAMSTGAVRVLESAMSVKKALQRVEEDQLEHFLIAKDWGDWTWSERRDLERAFQSGRGDEKLEEAVPMRSVVRLYPDVSLDSALRLLGPYPILPVSSRANPNRLLGTLTLEDVHRAYGVVRR